MLVMLKHWFLLLILGIGIPFALWVARDKPLWFDEILTHRIARVETFGELWHQLESGTQSDPPLFYLACRASMAVFGENKLAFRFPSLLGIVVMCLALYAFVGKRYPIAFAQLAVIYALLPPGLRYAYDARPYGLWLGWSGLTLLCWQKTGDEVGWKRIVALVGLCVCSIGSVATHYYAVLFLVAMGIGELWRSWYLRRIDISVWLALACAVLPLLAFRPLIQNAKSFIENSWAAPKWGSLVQVYLDLFKTWVGSFFVFVAITLVLALKKPFQAPQRPEADEGAPPYELAIAVAIAAIPIYGFILAIGYTNNYDMKYCLPAICGFAILVAAAVNRIAPQGKWPVRLITATTGAVLVTNCLACIERGVFMSNPSGSRWPIVYEAGHRASNLDATLITTDLNLFVETIHYHPDLPLVYVCCNKTDNYDVIARRLRPQYPVLELSQLSKLRRFVMVPKIGGLRLGMLEQTGGHWRRIALPPLSGGQTVDLVHLDALPASASIEKQDRRVSQRSLSAGD